jgi:hypothetical protein
MLFPFRDLGADACLRIETRYPGAARAAIWSRVQPLVSTAVAIIHSSYPGEGRGPVQNNRTTR